jgi:hypothetical protein
MMGPSARRKPPWRIAVPVALVVLWLGLSGLLVVARGDPEAWLRATFGRYGRADAFEHLNGVSFLFWLVHSSLVLTAIVAARYRRSDVLAVLLIGPVIGLAIGLLGQTWSDPNWFIVVAVCTIGWLVGTVVGGVYWVGCEAHGDFRLSGGGHGHAGCPVMSDDEAHPRGEGSWPGRSTSGFIRTSRSTS